MTSHAIVLWEDGLAQGAKTFGPHQLLLACLADELGVTSRWEVSGVKALPLKGYGNVRQRLEMDATRLTPSGEKLVVVYDSDQVARLYDLPATACKSQLLAAIRRPVVGTNLGVVLLERNVETLVNAAAVLLNRGIVPKSPNARDAILNALATAVRAQRDSIRGTVPSFERLVATVLAALPRK